MRAMPNPHDPKDPLKLPQPVKAPKGAKPEKERPTPVRFSDWASI